MIKENGNEKKNGKGFFEKRLLIGIIMIAVGVFVVFLDAFSLLAFQYFATFVLLALIMGGSIEIWWNAIKIIRRAKNIKEISPKVKELYESVVLGSTGSVWAYFGIAVLLIMILVWEGNSLGWFLLVLAPPGAFDGTAFITGKLKGEHRIKALENISRNKTWEGTIAGFIACIILALIILVWKFSYLEFWQMLTTALVTSACAFFGDLIMSKYKRVIGAKDLGAFMKGHGGILDRIDSQSLTAYGIFLLRIFWFL